jgi:hypothetical protein
VQVAVSQAGASGDGWQSDTYLPLVAQSTGQYTHKRDFDPTTSGSDGIVMDADVNVLFRQVDGPAGISPVETGNFRIIPRPTPGGFGPLRPYNPPSNLPAGNNNDGNYTGVAYISETTNVNMLQLSLTAVNTSDKTFGLQNTPQSTPGKPAVNVNDTDIYYHVDERTWRRHSEFVGLRFPMGVPLLIAIWRVDTSVSSARWRNGNQANDNHGEQRIVVY